MLSFFFANKFSNFSYFIKPNSRFPSLGYFRNGEYLKFKGDIKDEKSVLKWLTSDKAIMLPDQIEEVNELMLSKVCDNWLLQFVPWNLQIKRSGQLLLTYVSHYRFSCYCEKSQTCLCSSTTMMTWNHIKWFVG